MSADPKQAAGEVMGGRPGPAARAWLGPITILVVVLFVLDTYLVETGPSALAAVVIVLTCLARVWAGDHWPSDVIGGVLLGLLMDELAPLID